MVATPGLSLVFAARILGIQSNLLRTCVHKKAAGSDHVLLGGRRQGPDHADQTHSYRGLQCRSERFQSQRDSLETTFCMSRSDSACDNAAIESSFPTLKTYGTARDSVLEFMERFSIPIRSDSSLVSVSRTAFDGALP